MKPKGDKPNKTVIEQQKSGYFLMWQFCSVSFCKSL